MGLEVTLTARAEGRFGNKDSLFNTSGSIGGVTKWQAIDKSEKPYEVEKCYFI